MRLVKSVCLNDISLNETRTWEKLGYLLMLNDNNTLSIWEKHPNDNVSFMFELWARTTDMKDLGLMMESNELSSLRFHRAILEDVGAETEIRIKVG